jgi:ATP-dependent Clp protease ATP-binding subunit ClpC
MPKVNVYLPDRLAADVKAAGLPVSAICQRALERVLREVDLKAMTERPSVLGIYGRFLQRARQSLDLAYEEAVIRRHATIQSEDLLVGILQQGSNFAVYILESLGVSPDDVIVRTYDLSPAGEAPPPFNAPLDRAIGDDTRRALALAAQHAAARGAYVGNEQLLYGLAAAEGTLASRILAEFAVDAEAVARAMREQLRAWVDADRADDVP